VGLFLSLAGQRKAREPEMGIVRFSLRWPYTFYVLALLILFLGVTVIRSMPVDIFPEIDIPVVTVIWQETGLSTPEMEQRVTTYSEYSISSNVNGIKDIEAQTTSTARWSSSRMSATSATALPCSRTSSDKPGCARSCRA
jgi:Cu/Ag efflux pump CusA